ncbi:Deoxyhypusine synthase-domain-containing protein [Suillus lakei]|nr:Deoxyhypusine synthase-domain-containing protein [Suillus lakei]
MRKWRLSDEPISVDESEDYLSPEIRAQTRCDIFLGYTSNLISSGLREIILYLVKHKHVAAIVTTAGGIEEDFIKCLGKTYLADFNMDGADLRSRGMNRIGNLVVPNDNYCKFEDWLLPILDTMLAEQQATGEVWSPSSFIRRLGKEINNEESVYYWAYKNDIPVFCPALTDGSLGDMIYFHSFRNPWADIGYCSRHPGIERIVQKIKESWDDHPWWRSLQTSNRQRNVNTKWCRLLCIHKHRSRI